MALENETFVNEIYAIFNPIVQTMNRYDWKYTSVGADGNGKAILAGGGNAPSEFVAGHLLRVVGNVYHGTYEILLVSNQYVTIDVAYSAGDAGYVFDNEAFENPYIETQIYHDDTLVATIYNSPDIDGNIRIDYSKFLKNLFTKDNYFNYQSINAADTNLSSTFKEKHLEHWVGSTSISPAPAWSAFSDVITIVFSAMQLQNYGGGKLSHYSIYNPPFDQSNFLTKFERPKWFYGYPFDLQFLRWQNVPSVEIVLRRDTLHYRMNGTFKSLHQNNLISSTTYGIWRMMLHDCAADEAIVDVYLKGDIGGSFLDLINYITVDVDHTCYDNPIYLCWLNTLGGWDYWLFHTDHLKMLDINETSLKTRYVDDWENDQTINDIILRNAIDSIRLGASQLTEQQINGIKEILYSPKVMMLSNPLVFTLGSEISPAVPPIWKTVIVREDSFELLDIHNPRHAIEFDIELPQINIQQS